MALSGRPFSQRMLDGDTSLTQLSDSGLRRYFFVRELIKSLRKFRDATQQYVSAIKTVAGFYCPVHPVTLTVLARGLKTSMKSAPRSVRLPLRAVYAGYRSNRYPTVMRRRSEEALTVGEQAGCHCPVGKWR